MIILGIDPGTRRIGYGVIKSETGRLELLDVGLIDIKSRDDHGALLEAKRGMDALCRTHQPDLCSIEKLYFSKNQKTALQVAAARGAIVLSALEHGIRLFELAPNEVKSAVTGYGSADKTAVLKMVKLILKRPELKIIDDASDALAIAIAGSLLHRAG